MLVKTRALVRALNSPIRQLPAADRIVVGLAAIACSMFYAIRSLGYSESVYIAGDARFYEGIATGNYSQVMQPFASRQLGALVVTGLMRLLHCTMERGFVFEGALSIVVLLVAVYYVVLKTSAPRWLLFAIALVPFWSFLLQDLVLPDLWYSALLAVMLLLLDGEHMLAASLMMFPLMLSRESTSLTLVCFLFATWKRLSWSDRAVAVISAVSGSALVSHLAARAQPNSEHLPGLVYMFAKVPWNFLYNVLALAPWSNVNTQFCAVPRWSLPLHLGHVHAIGICGFSVTGWIYVSEAALSEFGLLPLLVGYLWWNSRKTRETNVLLRFALLYGAASLVLAPVLGTWFTRLIGYAWPVFFVALPMLFNRFPLTSKKPSQQIAAIGLFGVHVIVFCWSYRFRWVAQLEWNLLLWGSGFFLLRYWLAEEGQATDSTSVERPLPSTSI